MKIKLADLKKLSIFLLIPLAIFSFFIFKTQAASQSDAIGVRVMPNPEHSSIADWYAKQGFKGTPQSLIVDGYEAIRDGRTVFVNAANLDLAASKLYTNVYLISFNQESETNTVDILGQLVSHWKFNNNILTPGQCAISKTNCQADSECPKDYVCSNSAAQPNFGKCILKDKKDCLIDSDCPVNLFCDSLKAKVTRDVKRLGELNNIRGAIATFKNNNSAYPSLKYATYIAGSSLSLWPSWQDTLLNQLRITTSITDPINSLGYCDKYDPITCWNKDTNEFVNPNLVLPYGSYAYIYRATQNGVNYNLCAVFESKAAGIDTAEGQFTANSCAVGQGYGGADSNSAPVVTSSYTDGETGKEFNGYIKAKDAEGDLIFWKLTPVSSDWSSWSAMPVLKEAGTANQKKIFAAAAGRPGTYKMLLTLSDSRGAVANTEITINISVAGRPLIEADNIDYFVDPVNSLKYTFYIKGSNSVPTQYTFSPVNPALNQAINAQIAKASSVLNNIGINRTKVDLVITFPPGMSIPQDVTIPYQISATVGGATATKNIEVNLKMEQPYLNFECENMARLGRPYQISDTAYPRSCLLGNLKSGNHNLSYSVSGADGLTIRNDATDLNSYLEAAAISGSAGDKQIKVRAVNEYLATTEKTFTLKVNTFCGDGGKQRPNTEGRGGLSNDGNEECDGTAGITYNVSTSSALQYGCTTDYGKSPYPILDNKSCIFKPATSGGGYCGDGYCQFNVLINGQPRQIENCDNCPQDCGKCACTPSCTSKNCGDNGCGGVCGTCSGNATCGASGRCACVPDCAGKTCGDDGCGGTCGTCSNGKTCSPQGACVCNPNCSGKVCGGNGCAGNCGSCASDESCSFGACVKNCVPSCIGKNCGNNGCGGSCGTCLTGTTCSVSGTCECVPNCSGKTCGNDGCGGTCGTCLAGTACSATGTCECTPNCNGKTCGSNGCGGTCGTCTNGETCSATGTCAPISCSPGYYDTYGFCSSCSTYTYYCPGGTPAIQYPVTAGYYSTGGTPSTRTGQIMCPAGSWCSSGQIILNGCPPGYYCPAGTSYETVWNYPCPSGTINPNYGGASVSDCKSCPAGTTSHYGTACY